MADLSQIESSVRMRDDMPSVVTAELELCQKGPGHAVFESELEQRLELFDEK